MNAIIKSRKKFLINPAEYQSHHNHQQYVYQKLRLCAVELKIDYQSISVIQLSKILVSMKLNLSQREVHQAFIFSQSVISDNKSNTTKSLPKVNTKIHSVKSIQAITNNRKLQIDATKLAKWLMMKIDKKQIQLNEYKMDEQVHLSKKNHKRKNERTKTSFSYNSSKAINQSEYPVISSKPEKRFISGVKNAMGFFDQIRKERQQHGIEPISISDSENQEHPKQQRQADAVYYDPTQHDVNQKIYKLRQKIEHNLTEVIQASTYDKNLRKKLESALVKYADGRANKISQIGKYGSLKAYRRMAEKRKKQINDFEKIRKNLNLTAEK